MTRFLLVRHGHVEGIEPERFRGRAEIALSALGRAQAAALAGVIAKRWHSTAIFTSPMGRCVETANLIAERTGKRVAILNGLNDLDYGDWQWKTHADAQASAPTLFKLWRSAPDLVRFPRGESLQDLAVRIADALRSVIGLYPRRTVVLVGHDSVNRAIVLQALGLSLSAYWRIVQSPCGISEIDIDGERVTVVRVNETAHLDGLQS